MISSIWPHMIRMTGRRIRSHCAFVIKIEEAPPPPPQLRWSGNLDHLHNQTYTVDSPITVALPTADGGVRPYTYSVSGLPPGLMYRSDPSAPQLYGTPTKAGTYFPVHRATDREGSSIRLTMRVTVQERPTPPLRWSHTVGDKTYTVGSSVTLALPTATGGDPPYRYRINGEPPGLDLAVGPGSAVVRYPRPKPGSTILNILPSMTRARVFV